FFHDYLRPFTECGCAVLVSDHVSKDKDQRGHWARGTGAKMGRYDGVSYTIELISAYSPGKEGRLRLKIAKDRCGGVGASKSTVGDFIFEPTSDEQTQITFRFPEILPDGGFKPTAI